MDEGQKKPDRPAAPGRVHHDRHGRAIWQWAIDTGKHALDSTSALLKRLDVPGLKVEEDRSPFSQHNDPGEAAPSEPPRQSGYDPYGSTASGEKAGASRPGTAGRPSGLARQSAAPARTSAPGKPSFFKRLFGKR